MIDETLIPPSCSLEYPPVQATLKQLHRVAKNDIWKFGQVLPRVLIPLLKGKRLMSALTPEMLKDAYIPISKEQGRLLYSLVRAAKAKMVVEFGSSFGVSTLYLAAAVKDMGGHLVTTEILSEKCRVTQRHLQEAELDQYVTILEGDATVTLRDFKQSIDVLFLDGWKDLYVDVLDLVQPFLKAGSMVIGDNINLSDAKPYLSRVEEAVDFVTTRINKYTALSIYTGN